MREIRKHDRLYYVECKPEISDYEYDQLYKQLEAMEREHPEWVDSTSPTQRVGKALTQGFIQREHSIPMLSLANSYSREEVGEFIKRVQRLLEKEEVFCCCELKMDGIAVSVRYEEGEYRVALTRGDGKRGDDITQNMKTIAALPLVLQGTSIPQSVEVRGEVFLPIQAFQELNEKKQLAGEEVWANPRNAAAGSLKLLDPHEVAKRHLSCVFYAIAEESLPMPATQEKVHEQLKAWALPSFAKEHYKVCRNLEEIMAFAQSIEEQRDHLPFQIDGIVIKVNQLSLHDQLGETAKTPRYAIAYKFAPEQAKTRITEITVQVGRTGVLTPVAELEPVFLAGSTISRATLHNQDEIDRKGIRVGDTVVIEKGGDVIPKVVSVDVDRRPSGSSPWQMPRHCPACNAAVTRKEGEVAFRCPNRSACPKQALQRIVFFASKQGMDIEHLGEKVALQLVETGLVETPSDIYTLTASSLEQLEGFKEKSIANLLAGIDASRRVPLAHLIRSLGIPHVGAGMADLLAEAAGSIEALAEMSKEELLTIEGVGEIVAEAIAAYFADPEKVLEIRKLLQLGVSPQKPKRVRDTSHPFYGKSFVLTGTLENFSRTEAAALIKERGGKVSGSVSSQTDFVLAGADPGSKLDKAHKLNVAVIDEKEFAALL